MQRQTSVEPSARALEVVVTWGASVLDASHVTTGLCTIGPARGTDCFVEGELVPVERYVLARVGPARPLVNIPRAVAGELRLGDAVYSLDELRASGRLEPSPDMPDSHMLGLPPGSACRLRFGAKAILLRPVAALAPPPRFGLFDTRLGRHVVVASVLHGLVGVATAAIPPDPGTLRLDGFARVDRFVEVTVRPDAPREARRAHPLAELPARAEPAPPGPAVAAPAPKRGEPGRPRAVSTPAANPERGRSEARAAADEALRAIERSGGGLFSAGTAVVDPSLLDGAGGPGVGPGDGGPGIASFPRGGGGFDERSQGIAGVPRGPRGPVGDPTRYDRAPTNDARTLRAPDPPRGRVEVVGALDPQDIQRVVRNHVAEYRYCYERSLQKRPDLAGKVVVRFVIGARGDVVSVKTTESTIGDADVGDCLQARIGRWTFPAPRGGGMVTVNYPFVFRPQ